MASRIVIPLDQGWHFRRADDGDDGYLPVARFPTQVHLDLLHHGLIPDPSVGRNEADVQWVGEKGWVYRTTFTTPEAARGGGRAAAVLALDGLDTFATVRLNGRTVLEADNMFVPERVDVGRDLRPDGDNELVIAFDAAYLRGWDVVDRHPRHRWGCWNGDVSRLGVRKAQFHWGWDWGPVLLTCGPWRPVRLELYAARVADLHADVDIGADLGSAAVVVHAAVEGHASEVRFDISLRGTVLASETVAAARQAASATFRVQSPELWYPVGYGEQPLYAISATLVEGGAELDSVSKHIGLRKVHLVQHSLEGQPGSSFFFRINNTPVFCRGSNWIPADNFTPRISRQRYLDWVRLAAEGNQCMIRVWGGGIYEEEAFYEACDQLGILVWHDFMFACGNYPVHADFLRSVEREARENLKRLRHHPCIVLWAGNNEDYAYVESEHLSYDPDDHDPQNWLKSDFPARYIYEKLLPDVCKELIPSTCYRPGSPWGGRSTSDQTAGDIHQWNVWHGTQEKWQNFDKLVGRFVSEFGMEAFPSIRTIDQAILPGCKDDPDRYAQSATLDFHNKASGHERRLALYLAENFRFDLDPLEYYVYCTQLMQAECLATAYRLWRREWRGPGREYCGGALLWQLDDTWPVSSWSICDYYLRPKLAYYAVKREMAPLTIGMKRRELSRPKSKHTRVDIEKRVKVEVWVSNLGLDHVTADCVVKAWDVETGKETFARTLSSRKLFRANRSTEVVDMDVPVLARDVELEGRTVVAAYLLRDGRQVARCVNWPEPFKHLHLQRPRRLEAELGDDGATVEVSAEVPVKGLALECEDESVRFDDNLVDIVPGETVRIKVEGASKDTAFAMQYLGKT
ncbi:hypothetical protein CDD83_6937 [Cordyceps sp. RAO-2017]|nr:hypothetical protein CDD83_6937 [Cordyceps sp. RAO-2017]